MHGHLGGYCSLPHVVSETWGETLKSGGSRVGMGDSQGTSSYPVGTGNPFQVLGGSQPEPL